MSRFQEKEKYLYIFIYVKYKENDFSQDYKVHICDIIIFIYFFLSANSPARNRRYKRNIKKKETERNVNIAFHLVRAKKSAWFFFNSLVFRVNILSSFRCNL